MLQLAMQQVCPPVHAPPLASLVTLSVDCKSLADPDSCNNEFAIKHFNNFQRALNVYSCEQYSNIWTCANCTDAYKRWLCSQVPAHTSRHSLGRSMH